MTLPWFKKLFDYYQTFVLKKFLMQLAFVFVFFLILWDALFLHNFNFSSYNMKSLTTIILNFACLVYAAWEDYKNGNYSDYNFGNVLSELKHYVVSHPQNILFAGIFFVFELLDTKQYKTPINSLYFACMVSFLTLLSALVTVVTEILMMKYTFKYLIHLRQVLLGILCFVCVYVGVGLVPAVYIIYSSVFLGMEIKHKTFKLQ